MHDLQPGQVGYRLIKRQVTRFNRIKRLASMVNHPIKCPDLQQKFIICKWCRILALQNTRETVG